MLFIGLLNVKFTLYIKVCVGGGLLVGGNSSFQRPCHKPWCPLVPGDWAWLLCTSRWHTWFARPAGSALHDRKWRPTRGPRSSTAAPSLAPPRLAPSPSQGPLCVGSGCISPDHPVIPKQHRDLSSTDGKFVLFNNFSRAHWFSFYQLLDIKHMVIVTYFF